jgi:hypothetical protein
MHILKKPFVTIFADSVILLAFLISFPFCSGQDNETQPLSYNHKIHVEDVGLECKDCHLYVEDMAAATIPTLDVCGDCHADEPISESSEETKLLKYIAESKEIPWIEIYDVPDHVYFSHRRHVIGGELECSACHGNVGEFTRPVTSEFIPVTMENCMDCHKQHQVTNDCLSCHR